MQGGKERGAGFFLEDARGQQHTGRLAANPAAAELVPPDFGQVRDGKPILGDVDIG